LGELIAALTRYQKICLALYGLVNFSPWFQICSGYHMGEGSQFASCSDFCARNLAVFAALFSYLAQNIRGNEAQAINNQNRNNNSKANENEFKTVQNIIN